MVRHDEEGGRRARARASRGTLRLGQLPLRSTAQLPASSSTAPAGEEPHSVQLLVLLGNACQPRLDLPHHRRASQQLGGLPRCPEERRLGSLGTRTGGGGGRRQEVHVQRKCNASAAEWLPLLLLRVLPLLALLLLPQLAPARPDWGPRPCTR